MELFLPHGPLGGRVDAIASKSQLQRLLLCAALADRETVVHGASDAADVQAMCRCLQALGARVTADGKTLRVQPVTEQAHGAADCGESGATLRFLLPVAAALGKHTAFHLHGRLPQRPLGPLWEALELHGVRLSRPAPGELLCAGRLQSGRFALPGDVSSQFFSGLLFALPLLSGPSELRAATPPDALVPGLALENGFVKTDAAMRTNIPGLFAAGDMTGKPLQVANAVGDGLVAALAAVDYLDGVSPMTD